MDLVYSTSYKYKKDSDIYSFGVVLFDILCRRLAYDLVNMVENDKWFAQNQVSFKAFLRIAYQCLAETQAKRPTMEVVTSKAQA